MEKYFNNVFPWLFECEKIFGFENLKGYDKQDFMHIFLKDIYLFGLKNILRLSNGLGYLKK